MRGEVRTVRWRALFDAMRVPWRDRGANTSRGHINIRCPWCGNADPSHHLSVNEGIGAYRCYRDPQLHAGRSLPWLLLALGARSRDIDILMAEFAGAAPERGVLEATPPTPVVWEKYDPAERHPPALEYLRSRGYARVDEICHDFGLRFTRYGRMSWRVLFPLDAGGEILGAVGRATRADTEPRYLSADPYGGCVYAPHRAARTGVLLLCEGAFDVLTVALALPPSEVLPVAILGTAVPDARKLTVDLLARAAERVVYVPDADQVPSATYRAIKELELLPHISHIERLPLPTGREDLGKWAGSPGELRAWIESALGLSRAGAGPARTTPSASYVETPGASGRT